MQIENATDQGLHLLATAGERKRDPESKEWHYATEVELKFSRPSAVQAYAAAVKAWNEAKPHERELQGLQDPSTLIDPYTGAVPVVTIDLAKVAAERKVKPEDLLAGLRKQTYFRALEAEGKVKVS